MTTQKSPENREHPKGPNFLAIVVASGVFIVLVLLAAFLLLSERGKKMLPLNHKSAQSLNLSSPPAIAAHGSVASVPAPVLVFKTRDEAQRLA